MIVQPDFPDHWKTTLIVQACGDSAVRCLLRFWSHCQNRRQWQFKGLTPEILAAICKWDGPAKVFWDAMTQTFLDVDGETATAHEWIEINARLRVNWEIGAKGGRPKKPSRNPRVTLGLPNDNPRGNSSETEGEDRREEMDGIREDGAEKSQRKPSAKLSEQEWIDSLKLNAAYTGIDIDREMGRMQAWLSTPRGKGRKMSRGFVVNWLNKIDKPLNGTYQKQQKMFLTD